MERKNEQHARQKFIEEQLAALKYEEKALSEVRMTLMNQKWQLASEKDKIKNKIKERNLGPGEASAQPGSSNDVEIEVISPEPTTSSNSNGKRFS